MLLVGCASMSGPADRGSAAAAVGQGGAPYPPSRFITGAQWDFAPLLSHRKAIGSDLWPCAWARDGELYCAWGDGGGFDGNSDTVGRVSLGFARVTGVPDEGNPDGVSGRNVWGDAPGYAEHQAIFGGKVTSMVSVGGTLFAHGDLWLGEPADSVQRGGGGPVHTRLWSTDLGQTWQLAPWKDEWSQSFVDFGRDNASAPGDFVYIYYTRPQVTQRVYLKRIAAAGLRADPTSREFEYFCGLGWFGRPRAWSRDETRAQPVFVDQNGTDVQVVYDAPLGRYLLTSGHVPVGQRLAEQTAAADAAASTPATADAAASTQAKVDAAASTPVAATVSQPQAGRVGLFEAPQPWGPWHTVGYYENWGDLGDKPDHEYLGLHLPAKWISPEGTSLWTLFSSVDDYDSFNLVKLTLTLSTTERR